MNDDDSTFRAKLLQLLGDFPVREKLNCEIEKKRVVEGVTRYKLSYEVEGGQRIGAYLLSPVPLEELGKKPALLAIHQHAGQFYLGKSEPAGLSAEEEYHYGLQLCKRGYVVLCPDLLCFEDRRPAEYRRKEGTAPEGALYERFEAMNYLLNGSTLQAKYLSDLSAGLDLLGQLEGVDQDRIGVIGHSLGGQESVWLAWYDERVRACVSSCGCSLYRAILRDEVTHNFSFYVPGFLKLGDMDDLLAEIAPRPLLLTNGKEDVIFPLDGVIEMAQSVKEVYREQGHGNRFKSIRFPGGHGFPQNVREEAYDWLDKWLKD